MNGGHINIEDNEELQFWSNTLKKRLNRDEFKSLCFDLGINSQNLTGEGASFDNQIEGLVLDLSRKRKISNLLTLVKSDQKWSHIYKSYIEESYNLKERAAADLDAEQSPYRGMLAYEEEHAPLFFGRDALVSELVEQIQTTANEKQQPNFLAVIGASGSGKSSLVQAGLMPKLRDLNWVVHLATPTANPLEALAVELTRESESVTATKTLKDDLEQTEEALHLWLKKKTNKKKPFLLVLDQFEEAFTLCKDEDLRANYVNNLLYALDSQRNSPLMVILTLRADFYAQVAWSEGLRALLEKQQKYIGAMTYADIKKAIEGPAILSEKTEKPFSFQDGLIDQILADVAEVKGGLPLLSHALLETWKLRKKKVNGYLLTLEGYQNAGGVTGAIAKTADEKYQSFGPQEKVIVKNIFTRLTELGGGKEDTRRRASLTELIPSGKDIDEVMSVLAQLATARLITTDKDQVDVTHEALIREWDRLQGWLDADRPGLRILDELNRSVTYWNEHGQNKEDLLNGSRLDNALNWQIEKRPQLSELEAVFLRKSEERVKQLEQEVAQRQKRELKTAQQLAETESARATEQEASAGRLRQRAFGLAGALGLAMLLAIAAVVFGQRATNNANLAATQEWQAVANANLAATNEAEAKENANLAATSEVNALAQAEIAQENADLAVTREAEALAAQVEIGVERDRAEEQARLAQARELAAQAKIVQELDPELSIILARESLQLANTQEAETSLHLGLQRSRIRKIIPSEGDWGVLSPNRQLMVTGPWEDGPISIRGTSSQEILMIVDGRFWHFIDDRFFLTEIEDSDNNMNFEVWDIEQKEQVDYPISDAIGPIEKIGEKGTVISINIQDKVVATSSQNDEVILWDMTNNEQLAVIQEHTSRVTGIAFHPESERLMTSDITKQVYIWDLSELRSNQTVSKIAEFTAFPDSDTDGQENGIAGEFSPSGNKVMLVGVIEREAEIWDLNQIDQPPVILEKGNNSLQSGIFNQNSTVFIGELAGGVEIIAWDSATGEDLFKLSGIDFSSVVGLTQDEAQLITIGGGATKFWDIRPLIGSETNPYPNIPLATNIQASPDGKFVGIGGLVEPVYLISRESGKIVHTLAGDGGVFRLGFNPDGKEVVTVGADDVVRKWDVASGELLLDFKGHDSEVYNNFMIGTMDVKYHPSGEFFATASSDKLIKFWNAESGELIRTISGYPTPINDIAFSPDGKTLAAAGSQNIENSSEIWIWEVESGEYLATLGQNEGISWGLEFHPTEPLLATNGWNGLVRVWNYQTGEVAYESLNETGGTMLKLSFSDDGRYLATGGNAAPAQIYDALTGELLTTLTDYPAGGAEFTPDNHLITGTFFDGYIRELTVELDDALALADERVTRDLTEAECLKYLRSPNCATIDG